MVFWQNGLAWEKQFGRSSKKKTHPATLLLGGHAREQKIHVCANLHPNIHSSVIPNSPEVEITHLPIHWRMDKQNRSVYSGVLTGTKRHRIQTRVTTRMNVGNTMLSERSGPSFLFLWFWSYGMFGVSWSIQSQLVVAKGWGEGGGMGSDCRWAQGFFWGDEDTPELNSGNGCARQRMFKLCTIALISHASKVMLKILQARLQ